MTTETITCACGAEFQWTPEPSDYGTMFRIFRPQSCPNCEDAREAELLEDLRAERERRLAHAIELTRQDVTRIHPSSSGIPTLVTFDSTRTDGHM